MDPKRTEARTLGLMRRHGVAQMNVMGAYTTRPLRQLEYLFHEVSHWMTLGHDIAKLPRGLSNRILKVFNGIPTTSSNSLEIDTSLVTYLAGYQLGLWTDPGPIAHSCARNLKGPISLRIDSQGICDKFSRRWQDNRQEYRALSTQLAKWFRPSAKLLLLDDTLPF